MKCEKCKKEIEEKNKGKSQEEIEFEQWSDEKYCLKAVEEDGYSLRYVKEQNEAICLKAVEEDGDSLQYVKEQNEACLLYTSPSPRDRQRSRMPSSA